MKVNNKAKFIENKNQCEIEEPKEPKEKDCNSFFSFLK